MQLFLSPFGRKNFFVESTLQSESWDVHVSAQCDATPFFAQRTEGFCVAHQQPLCLIFNNIFNGESIQFEEIVGLDTGDGVADGALVGLDTGDGVADGALVGLDTGVGGSVVSLHKSSIPTPYPRRLIIWEVPLVHPAPATKTYPQVTEDDIKAFSTRLQKSMVDPK